MRRRFVAARLGGRAAADEESTVRRDGHGEGGVSLRAAERAIPNLVAAGVHPYDPEVPATEVGAGFVPAGGRSGHTRQDEPTVVQHRDRAQGIHVRAAVRGVPEALAGGVEAHDPKVVITEIGTGFAAIVRHDADTAGGGSSQDVTAVAGHFDGIDVEGTVRCADGLLPLFVAFGIEFHDPDGVVAAERRGLVAAEAGAGRSSQHAAAIGGVTDDGIVVEAVAAEAAVPLFEAERFQRDGVGEDGQEGGGGGPARGWGASELYT